MSIKEERIKSITNLYYSNPQVQKIIFEFGKDREVVPNYNMKSFGKRPDTLQYPSDIKGLVNKGATSFHSSEEIWKDPLEINSDMSQDELSNLRKGWDLLIDIDSPFLDYSKIAAELIIDELERYGIENYGLKFSGSKGFHIIVPSNSFPTEFLGKETRLMFPEWPRAISEYIMYKIKPEYNKRVTSSGINFEALETRTHMKKEDVTEINCPNCSKKAKKTNFVSFKCERCNSPYARPNFKITKRKLKCMDDSCPGFLEVISEEDYFFCENCKTKLSMDNKKESNSNSKFRNTSTVTSPEWRKTQSNEFTEEVSGDKIASLDLVLVASRHLFRMPYSLHEKTALVSTVIDKTEIRNFSPRDAHHLKINVKKFYPTSKDGEATELLRSALAWSNKKEQEQEKKFTKDYQNYSQIDLKNITEDMFPKSIKKLLKGLQEGRKRGLFVLLTFLKSLNFSPDYINDKVRIWNKKNTPQLKEGYVRSQIDWHLKQKKKILPPNYKNDSFYKDLKLIDKYPEEKNPLVEVMKIARKRF